MVGAVELGIERDGRFIVERGLVVAAEELVGRAERPADGRLDFRPTLELALEARRGAVEQFSDGEAGPAGIEPG